MRQGRGPYFDLIPACQLQNSQQAHEADEQRKNPSHKLKVPTEYQ